MRANKFFASVMIGLVSCASVRDGHKQPANTLQQVFEQRGLTMLPNPASDYIPGTLLFADNTEGKWLIACNAEKALPGIREKISISNTSSFSINLNKGSSLSGNLSMLELASVAAEFGTQDTITLIIANPVMLKIDHASLQGTSIDRDCVRHLNLKSKDEGRDKLLLIMEALQADVEVIVKFDKGSELTADLKNGLLTKISSILSRGAFGAVKTEVEIDGDAKLVGEKLIWGVRADKKSANFFLLGHEL